MSSRGIEGPQLYSQSPLSDGFTLWRAANALPPESAQKLRIHVYAPPFANGGGQELQQPEFPVSVATMPITGLYPTGVFRVRACYVYDDGSAGPLGPASDADTLPAGCGPDKKAKAKKQGGCVLQ